MDWLDFLVFAVFAFACLLAVSQSRREDWSLNRQCGTALFLVGVAVALFLEDLLGTNTSLLPWTEAVAVVLMLAGLLTTWLWDPD